MIVDLALSVTGSQLIASVLPSVSYGAFVFGIFGSHVGLSNPVR
jgi:hypothetical protein